MALSRERVIRLVAGVRRARRARTRAMTMATHMQAIPKIKGHFRAVTVAAGRLGAGTAATAMAAAGAPAEGGNAEAAGAETGGGV